MASQASLAASEGSTCAYCVMSVFAEPTWPVTILMGVVRMSRARFSILRGIVAEKRRVWRSGLIWDTMERI